MSLSALVISQRERIAVLNAEIQRLGSTVECLHEKLLHRDRENSELRTQVVALQAARDLVVAQSFKKGESDGSFL